jgi:hypothetical protein
MHSPNDTFDDPDHALSALSTWLDKAKEEARRHGRHNRTMKAVQNTALSTREREAMSFLYDYYSPVIAELCQQAYSKARTGTYQPTLELEDLVQEAFILFQRVLVAYDGGDLEDHLRSALPQRVKRYLQSRSEELDDRPRREEDRQPVRNRRESRSFAPGYDLSAITDNLIKSGRLATGSDEEQRLRERWRSLRS